MNSKSLSAGLFALLLVLVGCTPSDNTESPTDSAATESGAVAKRIVSLSPTATETLFDIGAGDQVVAVDSLSDVPENAPRRDFSGFQPNPEAVIAEDPDLVIASQDANGLGAALEAVGIELLVLPAAATFEQAYEQIEQIGERTGHSDDSKKLVSQMKEDIAAAVDSVDPAIRKEGLNYFHEADPTLYSAGDSTFIGQAYAMFGMKSIAGPSDGYPQLTNEAVIDANPDLIFLADSGADGGVTPDDVSARPGWNEIDAVKNNRIIELDANLASRWGPRLPQLIEAIADAVKAYQPVPA
ncbi:MAG: ABC transporter substrate-binding protein [Corynebacterium sp.]|uniref:ABC transporter substrate-binding protein n=1 Tax=Corynebacterium sp. TaxID=1720 RepID=UPI0026DA9063|nr:ABC transporter substrate-binding protein [Corynebacterium sp.]MDO5030519.1 ABC transporter substrate-binding protein [Corynebacterium sp.]